MRHRCLSGPRTTTGGKPSSTAQTANASFESDFDTLMKEDDRILFPERFRNATKRSLAWNSIAALRRHPLRNGASLDRDVRTRRGRETDATCISVSSHVLPSLRLRVLPPLARSPFDARFELRHHRSWALEPTPLSHLRRTHPRPGRGREGGLDDRSMTRP